MKRCSLCYCELPKDSTKRRRLRSTSSSFSLQAFIEVSSEAGLESSVPVRDEGADGLLVANRRIPHLQSRFAHKVLRLYVSSYAIRYWLHAQRICGSYASTSCDILHLIGPLQIPLENTKTVQRWPDPSSACWWCNTSSAAVGVVWFTRLMRAPGATTNLYTVIL